jgi:hypothetical protein
VAPVDLDAVTGRITQLEAASTAGADICTLAMLAAACANDVRPLVAEVLALRGETPRVIDWDLVHDGWYPGEVAAEVGR